MSRGRCQFELEKRVHGVVVSDNTGWTEFNLQHLGEASLGWRQYVIIDLLSLKVRVTDDYFTWKKELANLYLQNPQRKDISAFRVMRGFNPVVKTVLKVS